MWHKPVPLLTGNYLSLHTFSTDMTKFVQYVSGMPQYVIGTLDVLEILDRLHFQEASAYMGPQNKQTNSVVLVRKRTIPTERPPHVGEVSANFLG
jgi:hypothetical protein